MRGVAVVAILSACRPAATEVPPAPRIDAFAAWKCRCEDRRDDACARVVKEVARSIYVDGCPAGVEAILAD